MATMQDIAKEAGVSRASVSFVLNKNKLSERISKETRQRIKKAAAKLGYTPNEIARSMVSGKSKTLGLIVDHNSETEYGAKMISGMMRKASERGYSIKLFRVKKPYEEVFDFCIGQCLAGVAFQGGFPLEFQEKLFQKLKKRNVPLAFLSLGSENLSKGIHVMSDDFQGGILAFEHLYNLGHRRFLLLSEHSGLYVKQRVGLPESCYTFLNEAKKCDITKTIKELSPTPTAIFCCTDLVAAFALTSLLRNGFKVPEDISIVGYGKLRFSESLCPSLTSVEEFHDRQAERTVDIILDAIENGDGRCFKDKIYETIEVRLAEGGSSGFVKKTG
jgi:LacI family transcriptional regulator